MSLLAGVVIPFAYGKSKKLIQVNGNGIYITLQNIKDLIRSTFDVATFTLYNKKIGFEIPEDVLLPYLAQRKDFTNFVIEIVSKDDDNKKQLVNGMDVITESLKENTANQPQLEKIAEKPLSTAEESQITQDVLDEALVTLQGKELYRYFEVHNCLNDEQETLLARLVATQEINKILMSDGPLIMDHRRYTHIANDIIKRFPTQTTTTYFNSKDESSMLTFSGKLVDEFNFAKCRYLEKRGNIRYKQCGKSIQDDFPEIYELRSNKFLFKEIYFTQTYDLRMVYLKNIEDPLMFYRDFINGLECAAFRYIAFDFFKMYPGTEFNLLENWDQITERIFTEALVSGLKDVPLILDLYGNYRQLCSLMMFSYLLENYQNESQFQKDNPKNLIIHIDENTYDLVSTFQSKYLPNSAWKPRVFVYGKSGKKMKYYVLVDKFIYPQESALEAIDFCFKCYHALHLSYFEEQVDAWTLIEQAFFNIHVRECNPLYRPLLEILRSP